jgi:integrase
MNNIAEWIEMVSDMRTFLKPKKEWKALSESSRKDYAQKFAALKGRTPTEASQCKKTYYANRAAYLHIEARNIRDKLNTLDKWVKARGGLEKIQNAQGEIDLFAEVSRLGVREQVNRYKAISTAAPFVGASRGVDQATHGKRATSRLPLDWKTKIVGGVPKRSKYRAHVAAMAMCGCRPSEFEDGGVSVTKLDDDTYQFDIAGKKTGTRVKNGKSFTTGQSLRTITVQRTDMVDKWGHVNPEFIVLEKAMAGKKYMELEATATAIRDVVIHASEKAFPELKNKPTAYSFRHAFASELKALNGADSEETAAALGHASTKTQGCYGYGRSGGGGGLACKATASDHIRTPHLSRTASLAKTKALKAQAAKPAKVAMPAADAPKAPMPPAPRVYPKPKPSWAR